MSKVTVEVLNAVVDGKKQGEQFEIDSKSAAHLESIGYVTILDETESEKDADKDPKKDEVKTDAKTKQGNAKGSTAKGKQENEGQKKEEVGE